MRTKTYKTAVVVIPPREVWPPIQAIRREYDRHCRRWMPHITLIYPFRRRAGFDVTFEPFSRVCQGIQPFEIDLARFDSFRHRQDYTLWLAPDPPEPLIELQTSLWQVVPDCDEGRRHKGGFTPHLSVGQIRGRESQSKLLMGLRSTWTPIRFQVSDVSIIWRNDPPDDVFRVARRIKLGMDQ